MPSSYFPLGSVPRKSCCGGSADYSVSKLWLLHRNHFPTMQLWTVFGDKVFEKFGKSFILMHFSDQHPDTHKKMLLFKFALPDANSMADMTCLVALVLYYIDLIGRYKLSLRHGVKLPRNPWSDGPEYITQCPIQLGAKFIQKIVLSTKEGTLWWHAHNEWDRATVYGALVIYPKKGTNYPFSKPHAKFLLILGEWWKEDIEELYTEFLKSRGDPNISDALTINGQLGDLYPCSKPDTFKLMVEHSKTYLFRLINSGVQDILFFPIANHSLTIVGSDASYTKPFVTNYIAISPGQTIDSLLTADQDPSTTTTWVPKSTLQLPTHSTA